MRDSEATARAKEAACALRGCYEGAVEALGRGGRWEQALSVLVEGATAVEKEGLRLDASCFVPALRACCAEIRRDAATDASASWMLTSAEGSAVQETFLGRQATQGREAQQLCEPSVFIRRQTEDRDGWVRHRVGVLSEHTATAAKLPGSWVGGQGDGCKRPEKVFSDDFPVGRRLRDATLLLRRMETEAGVAPDAWGVNVVIEARLFKPTKLPFFCLHCAESS